MPHPVATSQIDSWIPPHVIEYCYGPSPSQLLPRGGRRIGMLAIGKCLKDQYDGRPRECPAAAPRSTRSTARSDVGKCWL
jgi:hypothetical protein